MKPFNKRTTLNPSSLEPTTSSSINKNESITITIENNETLSGEYNEPHNDVTLLNSFYANGKRHRVFLHSNLLTWEIESTKNEKSILHVSDIVSIRTNIIEKSSTTAVLSSTSSISSASVLRNKEKSYNFTIYYAKRKENFKKKNIWRIRKIIFSNTELRIVTLWTKCLSDILLNQSYRPKKLLLFVNPFGGKKEAMKIYEKKCKPLFHLANIDVNVIVSQRANQIKDIIKTQYLDEYDGIVCVGGDGTFSEVFNGLILRTMNDLGMNTQQPKFIPKPKIPIGVIPGGSTDTAAYCLHGTCDIETTVIHIILGQTDGFDLSSVSNCTGLLRFYSCVMGHGYLGDLIHDSEKFRWMGKKRYEYAGIQKFLDNRGYYSEISILMNSTSNPNDGIKCLENCSECFNAKVKESINEEPFNNFPEFMSDEDNEYVDEERARWKVVKGKFFMVNGVNISCACDRSLSGLSPYCHLGDGNIDVILVRRTSFFNNVRLFIRLGLGKTPIFDFPFVEVHRTKKYHMRVLDDKLNESKGNSLFTLTSSTQPLRTVDTNQNTFSTVFNCDGELLFESDVTIQSHCQLIKVFRRGLKPTDIKHQSKSNSILKKCCGS